MKKLYCKDYCSLWDNIDRDCDVYGERHPRLRFCPIFRKRNSILAEELLKEESNEKERIIRRSRKF